MTFPIAHHDHGACIRGALDAAEAECRRQGAKLTQVRRRVLDLVDVAHGNARELCEFTDSPDLATALRRLTDWGVRTVVVHLGAQGAGCFSDGQWVLEPPDLAEAPVHSTGTGDVLSVCMILLQGRTQPLSIPQQLRLSNRVVREFMEGRRTMIPAI